MNFNETPNYDYWMLYLKGGPKNKTRDLIKRDNLLLSKEP